MTGEPCILVNRTPDPLYFVADSKHHALQPGENFGFNTAQAQFAMKQNPLMGSGDYHSLEFVSLVGIKGETDCAPIDESVLLEAMDKIEWFDREASGLNQVRGRVKPVRKPKVTRGLDSTSGASQNAFAVTAEA